MGNKSHDSCFKSPATPKQKPNTNNNLENRFTKINQNKKQQNVQKNFKNNLYQNRYPYVKTVHPQAGLKQKLKNKIIMVDQCIQTKSLYSQNREQQIENQIQSKSICKQFRVSQSNSDNQQEENITMSKILGEINLRKTKVKFQILERAFFESDLLEDKSKETVENEQIQIIQNTTKNNFDVRISKLDLPQFSLIVKKSKLNHQKQ